MQFEVLHRIAGRIRFRCLRTKYDSVFRNNLHAILRRHAGIDAVRISSDCASVTLVFSETSFSPEQFLAEITEEEVLLADLPLGADSRKKLRKNSLYKAAHKLELPAKFQAGLGLMAFLSAVFPVSAFLKRSLLLLGALPIFSRGVRTFFEERRPGVDFFDGASIILLGLESAYLPASVMLLLIGAGEYIRELAAKRSQKMLDHLLNLSRRSAWLLKGETRLRVPCDDLNPGDLVVVYTGEQVPVDSVIVNGSATIVKADFSADSLPLDLTVGDFVFENSVLLEGKLYLKCLKKASTINPDQMLERERRRLLYRTPYQRAALRNAYNVVMPILAFASLAFLLSRSLNQALTIICFDLLTGIRIALPTAVLSYMYKAGRQGVLIKTGAALEELSKLDVIVFARTGVITSGESELVEIILLSSYSEDEVLSAAAAVEYRYHHAAARAIYRYARERKISVPERKNSELHAGLGVSAELGGRRVYVGSRRLMLQSGVDCSSAQEIESLISARGDSIVYLAFAKELVAIIAYRDSIRSGAHKALSQLKDCGIKEIIVSSGDAGESVQHIGDELGLEKIVFQLSPEEKADLVRDYQLKGQKVAFVGDDVSDAMAMAQADLAIALKDSTDLARYRADIVLTGEDLQSLPQTLVLSRDAMSFLRRSLFFVSLPNWLGLFFSLTNVIGPVRGTVLNNGSVILAALYGLTPALEEPEVLDLKAQEPS